MQNAAVTRALALAMALILLFVGVLQVARSEQSRDTARVATAHFAPAVVNAQLVRLIERPGDRADTAYVDIQIGERRLAGTTAVWVNANAEADHYTRRYGGRFQWFTPVASDTSHLLVEVQHELARANRLVYRIFELSPSGEVGMRVVDDEGAGAGQRFVRDTLGRTVPRPSLLPAPFLFLLGAALVLFARPALRPLAWPTLALTGALLALASLVAWPLMLELGLRRTLPAPLLAAAATTLLAVAGGPRAQALCADGPALRCAVRGAFTALVLVGVFITVQVSVNAFVAPVFRPPGGALTPAQWFVRDYIAPGLAMGVIGTPLAVLAGACYGLMCARWLPTRDSR